MSVSHKYKMLRNYTPHDAERLAAVYRDAVRSIGPQAYSPHQVEVWAAYPEDIEEFRGRLSRGHTLVAEIDGEVVAFGQIEPSDHIAFLYCVGRESRKGICSEILHVLEQYAHSHGVSELDTDASRISRPFFEKHGFCVIEVEHVVRLGVNFERFRMKKKK
ncbi:MAG: GNAT family N-acetyltransferase [Candidatus Methylacidiphilales bacterium]